MIMVLIISASTSLFVIMIMITMMTTVIITMISWTICWQEIDKMLCKAASLPESNFVVCGLCRDSCASLTTKTLFNQEREKAQRMDTRLYHIVRPLAFA